MTTERVGTMNMKDTLPDTLAASGLALVAPHCDILGGQEWPPQRNGISHVPGMTYSKPSAGCPPLWTKYAVDHAQAVTIAQGGFVGRIIGRRSTLPDVTAGLYHLTDHAGDKVAVLNWHLPATVEKGRLYRRILGRLSPRASMHRRARRTGRRLMEKVAKQVDRAYIVGDTNYNLMRLRTFKSCWEGNVRQGTHGDRTIDIVYGLRRAVSVKTYRTASDHHAVVAEYHI